MGNIRIGFWVFLLVLKSGFTYSNPTDSSKISIFFRSGRDITKPLPKLENYSNMGFSQALINHFSKSTFIQQTVGISYQQANKWGFGFLYSFMPIEKMNYNPEVYYANQNPGFFWLGSPSFRIFNLDIHLFSGRIEHSFQKKCFYATPYFEAGIGKINFPQFRYLVKKEDENQFVEVGSILESGNHFVLNLGAEVGVRFIENLFFFSASPGLAYYRIAWNQTDYRTTLSTNTIDDPKKYSSQQTRFIFTIALGARLPLTKEFFNKIF